jgi:hypothetical protein
MHIYIGALLLATVIILSILLLYGLPLGELTMGGRYNVWPQKLKPVAASQLAVQIFALYILLAASGTLPCFISENVTKIICFVFAVFFLGNTVMNFFSTSKKEKYIMTPMSAVSSICFLLVGLGV